MKYTLEIEINKLIDRVIKLFDDPDNMEKWMKGLQSFERISGTPGEVGAKSRMKFKLGSREIEMIETITVRNPPEEFSGTYESAGVFNTVKNKFIKLRGRKTKYISEQEYKFSGVMIIAAIFLENAFRDQSMRFLIDFKDFAENHD